MNNNRIRKIDFEEIKDKLFESGDYLPFKIEECSNEPVNEFTFGDTYSFDNILSIALTVDDSLVWE